MDPSFEGLGDLNSSTNKGMCSHAGTAIVSRSGSLMPFTLERLKAIQNLRKTGKAGHIAVVIHLPATT